MNIIIGDFGISSDLDVEVGMSKKMTSTGSRTTGYAAPELYGVAKDDNKSKILIGPEVDYYALGVSVFELLTGVNIFSGRSDMYIMRDTIQGRIIEDILTRPESENLSSRVKKLIQGLLTVRHDKRWGYSEVSKWLKGEDVDIYIEVHQHKIPTLKFGEKTISTIDELVMAIDADRELGKKYLMRGMFEQWAMKFDESLANDIIDIKELKNDDSEKLSILLFTLDPSKPCIIDKDDSISSTNDLLNLLRNKSDLMASLIFKEKKSDLYLWLDLHYKELSDQFNKAAENYAKGKNVSKRVSIISNIYLSLAGDRIKPFSNDDYEVSDVNDVINIPMDYREKVVNQLKNQDSILYIWLLAKNIPSNFVNAWGSIENSWDNLIEILLGKVEYFKGSYKTKKQIDEELNKEYHLRKEKEWEKNLLKAGIKEKKEHDHIIIKNEKNRIKADREKIKKDEKANIRAEQERIKAKISIKFKNFILIHIMGRYINYKWKYTYSDGTKYR